MQFKTDENLPIEVTELLRTAGYGAMSVLEQGMGGESDPMLDEVCIKEGRVLVTLDTDFADIRVYPPSKAPGYIVLRLKQQDKYSVIEVIERLIPMFNQEQLENRLWIVDEQKVRIRG